MAIFFNDYFLQNFKIMGKIISFLLINRWAKNKITQLCLVLNPIFIRKKENQL